MSSDPRPNLTGFMPLPEDQKRLIRQADDARALDDQRKRAMRSAKPIPDAYQAGFHSPFRG